MDNRAPEFTVEAFADKWTVKDVVKGILHTIFFHRFFPTVIPQDQEILDVWVPKVDNAELVTLIEARSEAVARQLDADRISAGGPGTGLRTQVVVTFSDKKRLGRRKTAAAALSSAGGSSPNGGKSSPTASPKDGTSSKPWLQAIATTGLGLVSAATGSQQGDARDEEVSWERWVVRVSIAEPKTETDRHKVRRAAEQTLTSNIMKIVSYVNLNKDHIPPITTTEANPFPYQIIVGTNPHHGHSQGKAPGSPTVGGGGWGGRIFQGY